MEPCPFKKDEVLNVIAVEPLKESLYVTVDGMNGTHHRAQCIPTHVSQRAQPLQPGDTVNVNVVVPTHAIVERITSGQGDGCLYLVREFQRLSPPA